MDGLQSSSLKITPEGATFGACHLAKQSRPGRVLKDFFFPSLPHNPILCPVGTLREYIDQTKQFRENKDGGQKDSFFLTTTGGHNLATIARWIKTALTRAGIDTSIFKAHSVRGATTMAAAMAGISITDILEAGDWSTQ